MFQSSCEGVNYSKISFSLELWNIFSTRYMYSRTRTILKYVQLRIVLNLVPFRYKKRNRYRGTGRVPAGRFPLVLPKSVLYQYSSSKQSLIPVILHRHTWGPPHISTVANIIDAAAIKTSKSLFSFGGLRATQQFQRYLYCPFA